MSAVVISVMFPVVSILLLVFFLSLLYYSKQAKKLSYYEWLILVCGFLLAAMWISASLVIPVAGGAFAPENPYSRSEAFPLTLMACSLSTVSASLVKDLPTSESPGVLDIPVPYTLYPMHYGNPALTRH